MNPAVFRQNQVVDQFRTVAECESNPGTENAVGDTAVISRGTVHRGNADTIADDFFAAAVRRSLGDDFDPDKKDA